MPSTNLFSPRDQALLHGLMGEPVVQTPMPQPTVVEGGCA